MELKEVLYEILNCENSLKAIDSLSYYHSQVRGEFYLASSEGGNRLFIDRPTVSRLIEDKEKSLRERLSQLQEAKKLAEKVIHGLLND